MWHKLDGQKQKIAAIAVALIVLYMAYCFSFRNAIEAYGLNRNLKKEASLQMEDSTYPHLNKKHIFYQNVLSGYKVKKEDIDIKIWQAVSDMAVSQQVKISYSPVQQGLDTAASSNAIRSQQFVLRGSYVSLVKLLDTLGKSQHIGRITQLEIAPPKSTDENKANGKLSMRLNLSTIDK